MNTTTFLIQCLNALQYGLLLAGVIRADEAVKDEQGNIVELRCSYDEITLGKNPEGRKVKGAASA